VAFGADGRGARVERLAVTKSYDRGVELVGREVLQTITSLKPSAPAPILLAAFKRRAHVDARRGRQPPVLRALAESRVGVCGTPISAVDVGVT
jgi:hypothetical protein